MPIPSPIVAAGDPGTVWTNESERIVFQFICQLRNSCGQCVQYHRQVGRYWLIPLHRGSILPGTMIVAPGVHSASRGFYDGPVARVRFADVFEATVPPNHPFLTDNGFAPAYALAQGDY